MTGNGGILIQTRKEQWQSEAHLVRRMVVAAELAQAEAGVARTLAVAQPAVAVAVAAAVAAAVLEDLKPAK